MMARFILVVVLFVTAWAALVIFLLPAPVRSVAYCVVEASDGVPLPWFGDVMVRIGDDIYVAGKDVIPCKWLHRSYHV